MSIEQEEEQLIDASAGDSVTIPFQVIPKGNEHILSVSSPVQARFNLKTDDFSLALHFGAAAVRRLYELFNNREAEPFPLGIHKRYDNGVQVPNSYDVHFMLRPD